MENLETVRFDYVNYPTTIEKSIMELIHLSNELHCETGIEFVWVNGVPHKRKLSIGGNNFVLQNKLYSSIHVHLNRKDRTNPPTFSPPSVPDIKAFSYVLGKRDFCVDLTANLLWTCVVHQMLTSDDLELYKSAISRYRYTKGNLYDIVELFVGQVSFTLYGKLSISYQQIN